MKNKENKDKKGLKRLLFGTICSVLVFVGGATLVFSYYFLPIQSETLTVTVPNFVGIDEGEARADVPFVIIREWVYSDDAPRGQVISQDPSQSARRKIDADGGVCPITLTVSLGQKTNRVPDVVGLPHISAATALREIGARVRTVYVYDSDSESETVLECSPPTSTPIKSGEQVTLFVSKSRVHGSVKVPDLTGMQREDACADIMSLGLCVGEIESQYSDEFPDGAVISQSLIPDIYVEHGTYIDLIVSLGSRESQTQPQKQDKEKKKRKGIFGFFDKKESDEPYGKINE